MRIDRYLSDMGYGTRSEIKKFIRSGRVYFCGKAVKDPGMHVSEDDELTIMQGRNKDTDNNGIMIKYEPYQYLLLNKPAGVVSAVSDPIHETVVDICKGPGIRDDIFPAGRLDLDTEGLLLLTNDGKLAHEMLTPGKHVEKEYEADLKQPVGEKEVAAFKAGLDIPASDKGNDAFKAGPAELKICDKEGLKIRVVLHEGKYHQVKRMFEAVENEVLHLKRIRIGDLTLPEDIEIGTCRKLDRESVWDMLIGK